MSRDIGIYSKIKQTISIEKILELLGERNLKVVWTLVAPSKIKKNADWEAGYFLIEGEQNEHKRVDLSHFSIMEFMRNDIVEHLTQVEFRDHIQVSETKYSLSVTSQLDSPGEKLLVNLAAIVAKLSDGIIKDMEEDRFFAVDEYERAKIDFSKR